MSLMHCLVWNNFDNDNVSKFLRIIHNAGILVDMTLVAEGHWVDVHQLIMFYASPVIMEMVRSIRSTNPVVHLNNVSYNTLSNIVQYSYTGEVRLSAEELPFFLQAARSLQIQGLQNY